MAPDSFSEKRIQEQQLTVRLFLLEFYEFISYCILSR